MAQGHPLCGLNKGALGSQGQVGKTLAHVDEVQPSPPRAVPYVFVPDLLFRQLDLDEGSHGGEELPPGPVLHPFVLLDVLLHAANGQVLDLSWGGSGAQQAVSPKSSQDGPRHQPQPLGLPLWPPDPPESNTPWATPCPQPPSDPQRVGGRERGPGSTALGTNRSAVIRNNFVCFICCLIISSTPA